MHHKCTANFVLIWMYAFPVGGYLIISSLVFPFTQATPTPNPIPTIFFYNASPSSPSTFIKPQVPTDAAILLDFLHALIEL